MIIRAKHSRQFTKVDNRFLRDPRLNASQVGLLVLMLSLPDEWVFHMKPLQEMAGMGRDALYSNLKVLEETGYLVRDCRKRGSDGTFTNPDWSIYEVSRAPFPENPYTDTPDTESPDAGDQNTDYPDTVYPTVLSTNRFNTDLSNTYRSSSDSVNARERERTGRYNNCPERDYDMDELERRLLATN